MEKSEKQRIDMLIKDVKNHYEYIVEKLNDNQDIGNLLLGVRVFFSMIIFNPKIYFIGINPGYGKQGIEIDEEHMLEYINEKCNNYRLAQETLDVFTTIGRMNILRESSFKTNGFFLTTKKESELYKITDYLGRGEGELGELIFKNMFKWTKELIEIINPKIIICEGNGAFVNLCISLNINLVGYEWSDDCIKIKYGNQIIIGYKRIWSNIKNKSKLALLINESLEDLNL